MSDSVNRSHQTLSESSYLRESTVIPDVALVWEAVAYEAQFALLDILLNGVQGFLLADLLM